LRPNGEKKIKSRIDHSKSSRIRNSYIWGKNHSPIRPSNWSDRTNLLPLEEEIWWIQQRSGEAF